MSDFRTKSGAADKTAAKLNTVGAKLQSVAKDGITTLAAIEESHSAYSKLKSIEIRFEAQLKVDAKKIKNTEGEISNFDKKISDRLNDAGNNVKAIRKHRYKSRPNRGSWL